MKPNLRIGLTVLATCIGFATLLLYTTLVQDIFFKGVHFCNGTAMQLILKTLGFCFAGLVTGFLASLLVLQDNYYPNFILSLVFVLKLFVFTGCQNLGTPFWYDSLVLMVALSGLWLGYYGGIKFPLSPA